MDERSALETGGVRLEEDPPDPPATERRTATSGRPLRPAIRDQHCVVPEKPLEISDVAGARRLEEGEQQSATLREVLSMLKSLMELEELARRVVGGDREAVHGLVRGSLPTLRGRCMARPRREAERADAIRRSAAVKVSLRQSRSV